MTGKTKNFINTVSFLILRRKLLEILLKIYFRFFVK